jgi:hypothetical protein
MSGRTPDSLVFQDEKYSILLNSPYDRLFEPQEFGITRDFLHTGAPRGFVCAYHVAGETLLLSSLEICAKDRLYPLIWETRPSFPHIFHDDAKCQEADFYKENETKNAMGRIAWHIDTFAFYGNIEIPMPYTGVLHIGRETVPEYYLGFIPGWLDWMHRKVFDLKFADGHLESAIDLSAEMATIREKQPTSEEYFASHPGPMPVPKKRRKP